MTAIREEQDWLAQVRAQILCGNMVSAQATLVQALMDHPASVELRRAQAGVLQRTKRMAEAEALLRELLAQDPTDAAAAFPLAGMLKEQGRMASAASTLRACFAEASNCRDANLAIRAIELLDNCNRKADAAAIADSAIAENPDDPRLHAYAGMLQIQLGEFESARQHYLFALRHDERAWEWHVPIGLSSAQRYASDGHPDFGLFRGGLKRNALPKKACAELHFALGKAHDDIGDYQEAARHFREGNAIAHRLTKWSRRDWRRSVEARLAAKRLQGLEPSANFTPIFFVGMPRSGTTLLAELLSRCPLVCNRGELPWIADLAEPVALNGHTDRSMLHRAVAIYTAQSRQDDAEDVHWFLDKQPLNFRYVDLMLAMFPDAKIVHCLRGTRDTALSLWAQCFLEDIQGYSYDFDDIAGVMRDEEKLMAHWRLCYPQAIRDVRYEELVADTMAVVAELAAWIGLPPFATSERGDAPATPASVISTASLWQARQPVHSRPVGRWQHYAPYVPELLRLPNN